MAIRLDFSDFFPFFPVKKCKMQCLTFIPKSNGNVFPAGLLTFNGFLPFQQAFNVEKAFPRLSGGNISDNDVA